MICYFGEVGWLLVMDSFNYCNISHICLLIVVAYSFVLNCSHPPWANLEITTFTSREEAMWRQEMEWLLCVSDLSVELMPSYQSFPESVSHAYV